MAVTIAQLNTENAMRIHGLIATLLLTGCTAMPQAEPARLGQNYEAGSLSAARSKAVSFPSKPLDPPASASADAAPAQDRSIIYNASLSLTVADIRSAQATIQSYAASQGGYLQEIAGTSITIRVPAARFQTAIKEIERLGELTDQRIEANDVTEEMHDLQIRLDNALHVRDRLTALLDKSTKVEETLAIEKQLDEITETIELLKGKMQYMQNRVALSTIAVALNSPRPQLDATAALPFAWVRELANGAVTGDTASAPDTSRLWRRNERFALPPGFVRYYERDGVTEAMSADNVVIRMRREDNYDGGDLSFWSKLVRRTLVESRAIAITGEQDVQVKDGTPGKLFVGTKDLGEKKALYLVGVVATKRYVYSFEAWGDQKVTEAQVPALTHALETLDVKHW